MKVQDNREDLELNGLHQLLVYADNVVVITEDVQNVHLPLEYRPHIDVSFTCEHDPKLQEYCVCPQNMPQFDSEGIPNQTPETNKPMILNGPTSRNREGSDQLPSISGGRLLYPQPEDAPCRGDRDPPYMAGTWFRERHCDDTPLAGQRQIQMERSLTPVSERVGVVGGRKRIAIIASHNVLEKETGVLGFLVHPLSSSSSLHGLGLVPVPSSHCIQFHLFLGRPTSLLPLGFAHACGVTVSASGRETRWPGFESRSGRVTWLRFFPGVSLNPIGANAGEKLQATSAEQSDGITVFRISPIESLMLHRCRTGAISLQRWWQSLSAVISESDWFLYRAGINRRITSCTVVSWRCVLL
ncbi:hypothetical protein ANN_18005 [Periplaneta americana]|uniref:Uncharacterized protein n=1 Tax=Periplaneta americana TaxID=6978 RepID=A0ABQ8SPM2_PERAM|nr:hypothetical protein ANN_18005 [Periplaneta americana]